MTIDPITDISAPFNARYGGLCSLGSCERKQLIDHGDVCQYVEGQLMHMVCARRVAREQSAPLCKDCWCYHEGECA